MCPSYTCITVWSGTALSPRQSNKAMLKEEFDCQSGRGKHCAVWQENDSIPALQWDAVKAWLVHQFSKTWAPMARQYAFFTCWISDGQVISLQQDFPHIFLWVFIFKIPTHHDLTLPFFSYSVHLRSHFGHWLILSSRLKTPLMWHSKYIKERPIRMSTLKQTNIPWHALVSHASIEERNYFSFV